MDKLKDKNFIKIAATCLIIFIVIVALLNWLIKSIVAERNKNQAENFNAYYQELLSRCGQEKAVHDCCFNSVAYMSANNFKIADIGCDPGYKVNAYNCLGTYKWCEPIR